MSNDAKVVGTVFANAESFVPKGWREVVGRVDPLPATVVGELPPISDEVIGKVPLTVLDAKVHAEFSTKTIRQFLESLKGKVFFTLPELSVACGFDNDERNLNQIVGTAEFRAVVSSFAKKGRLIKAKKGPGQGATSVENVKELAATLDL